MALAAQRGFVDVNEIKLYSPCCVVNTQCRLISIIMTMPLMLFGSSQKNLINNMTCDTFKKWVGLQLPESKNKGTFEKQSKMVQHLIIVCTDV